MLNIFWEGRMFDMINNIQNNSDEKRINNIVKELCTRSGEHILSLKNESDNKTFFAEHLTEIARAVANVEQKDLKNKETLNKFLFMCIGLFDTDDSRKIIYDKLTYSGIISVFKDMDNNHKLKYNNYLPDDLVTNDYFFDQLNIDQNSKVGKFLNPVYRFIHRHKKSDRPWVLDESEKSFFADSKKKIRDAIANLNKEDFKGNENEANKFKLLCCRLFSEAEDRQVIFKTIGNGSDADIIWTFTKLKLNNPQVRREFFVYLPKTLQITEAFQYAGFEGRLLRDLERKMLEEFKFEVWKDYALSLGFVFLFILSVPNGLANLILWCSSDYREDLKQAKINEKLSWRSDKELSEEDEKEIKSKMRCEFITAVLMSLGPAFVLAFVTYCFIVLPFGVFLSSFWLPLVFEFGLMIYMFIANFKLIKSLCKEIKDAVKNNKQIQRTLNERRDKWRETKQEIESKQREASAPKILLIDNKPAFSENEINTDSNKNLVLDNMDNDFELEK